MEWAIQAAKKKTQQPAGSSRSIIESLNSFNNITLEHQDQLNNLLGDANTWLNDGMEIISKKGMDRSQLANRSASVMVSPEKSITKVELETVVKTELSENKIHIATDDETPKRISWENLPNITPRSLKQRELQDIFNAHMTRDESPSSKQAQRKSSPWSPFKVEQTLKASVKAEPTMSSESTTFKTEVAPSKAANQSQETKMPLASEAKALIPDTLDIGNKSQNLTVGRMKRRSNMFVPLPRKDPLVVKPVQTNVHSLHTASLKSTNNTSPVSEYGPKGKIPTIKIRHSPRNKNNLTKLSKPGESVFDRLSSLSTKSFENKVNNKSTNKKYSPSSIDLSGSPKRRASQRSSRNSVDLSMQETLKNIFAPNMTELNPQRVKKTIDESPGRNRRSLIPRLDKNNLKQLSTPHRIPSTNKIEKTKGDTPLVSKVQEAAEDTVSSKGLTVIEEKSKVNPKESKKSPAKRDRLTKFQLLPPSVDADKHELKKKLNKRLSEVMKTQQEQERRRKHQQRKKSNADDYPKRQSRTFSEFKSFSTATANTNFSTNANKSRRSGVSELIQNHNSFNNVISSYHVDTNNILDALNTGDHRMKLADYNTPSSTDNMNNTLPEIYSDSDQEDNTQTLADWAREPQLQEQLLVQQNWDYKQIFGPVPPLHMDEIFQTSRLNKFKPRQSLKYRNQ
ncbi:hypothetical protein KAFR_0E02990 [Kazachstania africana CBS 2517]|uniref:Inner centromere protein ARK-binding domain-containing protein n=1 Tax=Kazachstania africana (strain ATCC 22294 / BCRC 22015 / CBS 2517 / CECT 1963 / NBRC 1671 / NRRL Y-8276) TaxID=1071382 RepID=H2AVQ1_KAZAF|nr:hypothetical protein KAFR_0E02990 [Kazachstania africana CBS 2517]CCF58451.1 hypothetical protein KAFR_0E02990 [Kazachstania africana CBS 2517]